MRFFCKLILTVLLVAAVARAQTPSPEAAKAEPSAAAPAAAPAAPAAAPAPAADQARPYVDSALTFLKAYTHTNRTGPEGEKAWADLRSVSIEKVPLKVAGKEMMIDATAGHADAQLIRFSKVSTWREAYDVQGVTIEKAQLKVGEEEHTGKGRLKLAEKDGKWIVQSLEIE